MYLNASYSLMSQMASTADRLATETMLVAEANSARLNASLALAERFSFLLSNTSGLNDFYADLVHGGNPTTSPRPR